MPDIVLKSKGTKIDPNVTIHNWSRLTKFGNFNYIGKNTLIDNCTSIGSFCSISADVKIGMRNHKLDAISTSPYFYEKSKGWVDTDLLPSSKGVVIENDVLISANVILIEGITVGTGAVIGAGAVVVKDVPPYAVVGGIPAKVIKYRFDEVKIKELLDSKWWEYSEEDLRKMARSQNLKS